MDECARARVLLVDDHALFRKGLARLLRTAPDFEVVGEAADGREAMTRALELRPDIILMDLRMPQTDGLEATRRILDTLPTVKIVILTATEDDEAALEAVRRGAKGYLLKTIEPLMLLDALRGLLRGEAAVSHHLAAKIMAEFARRGQPRTTEPASVLAQLSAREQDVLELVADGMSNKEIATVLDLAENTVKNHLKKVLEKLHLKNRVQVAVFALGQESPPPRMPDPGADARFSA